MSVIDKWLNVHRENSGSATSATTATNANSTRNPNGLDVATHLLQVATYPPDVAKCSNLVATNFHNENKVLRGNVAEVANVARVDFPRANVANVAAELAVEGLCVCCECGRPIEEKLETWWGGERCHRGCGEAAFQREKARGAYLRTKGTA